MATKKEFVAQEVARAVGAGKAVALETVDFGDPNRPKTCLEVDFPILPVNQVAAIEGNAGKPIYQMSKWWARRRSSVFRSMLIAAATKAPEDPSHAAKLVWDNYYANHQKKGAFKHLKVADIFMGGGTTLVEGSRLGMQMSGNDLNPVAWFVVKQELADVDLDEVKRLLADIEAEVKPQIMPFYYCDGPNGEKGTWTHKPSGKVMGADFDALTLKPEERNAYVYEGPEIIYTFWAKHGPCQVTGCGHRTPIMSSPVMAIKTISVKSWAHKCPSCEMAFDIEEADARMAPDVPLYVAPSEAPYTVLSGGDCVTCPGCERAFTAHIHPTTGLNIESEHGQRRLGKGKVKNIEFSLLVHPEWLGGSPRVAANGAEYGGSPQDDAASTAAWNAERAIHIRLLEVRGTLPETVTCPDTLVTFSTSKDGGTVPKRSTFTCRSCGTQQDQLSAIRPTGKAGPTAGYAIQAVSPSRKKAGATYGGRFFAAFDNRLATQASAASYEWEARKDGDLADYWPRSLVPFGFMTSMNNGGIPNHGFTHWWTMFNPRQLLVLAQLLKAICELGHYKNETREYILGGFQNYVRYQNMFCFWHIGKDHIVPHMSNNNYHPKANTVENSVFPPTGMGNFISCTEPLFEAAEWKSSPWEIVNVESLRTNFPTVAAGLGGKGTKTNCLDPVCGAEIFSCSSTDLGHYPSSTIDLIVTDPPFGGLLHYSELADFFHSWMRLALKSNYPEKFGPEYSPKSMEAVSNRAREPEDPDGFYQRLLTACWAEAHRALKPGGMLAFTFHHSEDAPWVSVLESLFDAGFYLEATYPIRSDETKGEGSKPGTFGSQQIEYDIIHVCRKRTEEPTAVSWGRMRREVLADVRQLQGMLENHARAGLPAADLQVIRRGKALEYFSRHYGKVYVDEGRPISVKDALVGINQLIDEDTNKTAEPPPAIAEPITRQFLRIFGGKTELARDQMQKLLRGSGIAPDEFTNRGWASEEKKVFHLVDPLEFARDWSGRHKRRLTADLDQALVLIGACYDGSGINASDTLKNEHFKPHAALKSLLDWLSKRGPSQPMRNAASRALSIYNGWAESNREAVKQLSLFQEE
jgi:putative DNA methylase